MPTLIEDIKFSSELRGYSVAANDVTSVLKANSGEKMRANIQFRVEVVSKANTGNGDNFTVTLISGTTYSLVSNQADFLDQNWRVGDVFDFINTPGTPVVYPGQTILLIQGNYIEFALVAGLPPAVYTDAEIRLTTELDAMKFEYNFTPASSSDDLIQQLLNSVQSFRYTNLVTPGAYQTGVAQVPVRGNTGSSQAKRRIATANYIQYFEIEHDFIPIPSAVEDQLVNLQTLNSPNPYKIETIFYKTAVRLGIGSNKNTFRPFALDRLINDDVGWFNENFDGGANIYTVDSLSYQNVATSEKLSQIEARITTKVTAVISTTGTFVTAEPIAAYHSYLPVKTSAQESVEDYQSTMLYESLISSIDAGAANGTIITNFTAVLAANILTVNAEISYTADQLAKILDDGAYVLYLGLEEAALSAEASNKVALILDANRLTKGTDIAGLLDNPTMDFYNHARDFTKGLTTGFSSLESWVEDGILLDGKYRINTGTELVSVSQIDIEVIAKNSVTDELFIVSTNSVPISTQAIKTEGGTDKVQVSNIVSSRNFLLQDSDQFKLLEFGTGAWALNVQHYNYQIGLKIQWQDWQALLDADAVFYDNTKPNNNLNKKTSNYSQLNNYEIKIRGAFHVVKGGITTIYYVTSPEFKIFDYEFSPDSYVASYEFKDENGQGLSTNLTGEGDTTCIITFDDGNTKTTVNNFEAITRLQSKNQGSDNSIHEISSLRGVISGDVLKPISGLNLEKSIVAGNYTTKCLIDGNLLTLSDYTISAVLAEKIGLMHTLFDGLNERVNIGGSGTVGSAFDFETTDSFSIGGWFYFDGFVASMQLLSKLVTGGAFEGYALFALADGTICFAVAGLAGQAQVRATSNKASTGQWYHIVATYDGSESASGMHIYIDNVDTVLFTALDVMSGSAKNTLDFNLGARPGATLYHDGKMDESLVSNQELSASNVSTIFNQGRGAASYSTVPGIIAHWKMDTLNPINEITPGTYNGTSINMDASNIVEG
jgi:hypothetical protein